MNNAGDIRYSKFNKDSVEQFTGTEWVPLVGELHYLNGEYLFWQGDHWEISTEFPKKHD